MTRRVAALAVAAWLVVGCGVAAQFVPQGGAYPDACGSLGFGDRQCAGIVAKAETSAGLDADAIDSIDILPPINDGVNLGGRMIARVRFHRAAKADATEEVWCTGVGSGGDRACRPDASIEIWGGVDHDIPCSGEPPDGCATPRPSARPASVAAATPLRLATMDIPIDHLGHYEVDVGQAGLPDGVLSERSATLADPMPTSFWIEDGIVLHVESLDPTRPPVGSVYREPFDGVEPVRVSLVFDVTDLTPGGVLEVRDIVVR